MDEADEATVTFQKFYAELIEVLLIDDLLPEFVSCDLLSGGQKAVIESRNTRKEKTEYFLDEAIKRGLDVGYVEPFIEMVAIMEKSDDRITREFAKKIKGDFSGKRTGSQNDDDTCGMFIICVVGSIRRVQHQLKSR